MSSMPQRSVIERLDPNVRFRLSTVSLQFRSIERLAPLTIKKLIMSPSVLQINDVIYKRKHPEIAWDPITQIWIKIPFEVLEHFVKHFLANRNESIVADTLDICRSTIETLASFIKFKTNHLLIDSRISEIHEKISLDPLCLPLKSITFDWAPLPLKSPIFQPSTTLIIRSMGDPRDLNDIENLPQRNIQFWDIDRSTTTVEVCRMIMFRRRLQKRFSFRIMNIRAKGHFDQYFNQMRRLQMNKEWSNPETRNTAYPFRLIHTLDNENLEMHYYYEKIEGCNNELLQYYGLGWNFVMEMFPRGTSGI